ncbi:MAG TPA: MerR family transcriptional regulator [Verrucomicrobiae bacterium]
MSRPSNKPTPDQFEFDGLFLFSQAKQNLTIQEVAAALGVRDTIVRDYLDEGLLVSGAINDKQTVVREHQRIARFSVVAFWRERLAEKGNEPPFHQSPQVLWWREELRKKRSLPSLEVKQ